MGAELDLPGGPPGPYGLDYDRSRFKEAHDDEHERTAGSAPAGKGRQPRRYPGRAASRAFQSGCTARGVGDGGFVHRLVTSARQSPIAGRGGRTTFEWLDGEFFLIERFTVDNPAAPSGIAIIGSG